MDATQALDSYQLITAVYQQSSVEPIQAYHTLYDWLDRVSADETRQGADASVAFDVRLIFLAIDYELPSNMRNLLQRFYRNAIGVLNEQIAPVPELLRMDALALALLVNKISGVDLPPRLDSLLLHISTVAPCASYNSPMIQQLRVRFVEADDEFLYVIPTDRPLGNPLKARYGVEGVNDEFHISPLSFWKGACLNLIDSQVDSTGVLTPGFIVLEPDYLIDVSALAECYCPYGCNADNYFLSRLRPSSNSPAILLGKIANLFLDEWIHTVSQVSYSQLMGKVFKTYAIELVSCVELWNADNQRKFFDDCKKHFDNIRHFTLQMIPKTPGLTKYGAVLEPAYMCQALGLQGRLDYMQSDMTALIELKSGKADESVRDDPKPKENNYVQMLLYLAMLRYSRGVDYTKTQAFLLYSRYPLLYLAKTDWSKVKKAVDLRNFIIFKEHGIITNNSVAYTEKALKTINSRELNTKHMFGRYWDLYLRPEIDQLQSMLARLTPLERNYFYACYNFVTVELALSKTGDNSYGGRLGAASLWLSTLAHKRETGEILYNLKLRENKAYVDDNPTLLFDIPYDMMRQKLFLPDFRVGDAVVIYQRNGPADNVTNQLVFKGNIKTLSETTIEIRLRYKQKSSVVLSVDSLYAVEHDVMDNTFRTMYKGLFTFLSTSQQRRDLLLSQRSPGVDQSLKPFIDQTQDVFERIAWKAKAAKDFFLLVGPPGTGKTSCALKKMVELFYADNSSRILLLAYTNRAVDEICKSISAITPSVDYIRLGSELSCHPDYHNRLIERVIAPYSRRADVYKLLVGCRIFVGTVASVGARPELFKLKRFDVAIVDEASQILEPQLLPVLTAVTNHNQEAVGKFILIGDHKQLPAVVLQQGEGSAVKDPLLNGIGLLNLRDSLFERLYRTNNNAQVVDHLYMQGRMHPDVASFANRAFYGNKLTSLGLSHQTEQSLSPRLAFFPSTPEPIGHSVKTNLSEAVIVARLAKNCFLVGKAGFDPDRTLGIITPYRRQIALIKREIAKLGIPQLDKILVDTVERFQGSERDTIIYSCCVNAPFQLRMISNMTKERDGTWVDRKLNVAMTRARKQLFVTGVPSIIRESPLYDRLMRTCGYDYTNPSSVPKP